MQCVALVSFYFKLYILNRKVVWIFAGKSPAFISWPISNELLKKYQANRLAIVLSSNKCLPDTRTPFVLCVSIPNLWYPSTWRAYRSLFLSIAIWTTKSWNLSHGFQLYLMVKFGIQTNSFFWISRFLLGCLILLTFSCKVKVLPTFRIVSKLRLSIWTAKVKVSITKVLSLRG